MIPEQAPSIFRQIPQGLDLKVNPYVEQLIQGAMTQELPLKYGPYLEGLKGHWRERAFARADGEGPLFLEIGCHQGKTICEMGAAYPAADFVGMDITYKRVVSTAQKAKQKGLSNVCSVLGDARQLQEVWGPQELDGVIVFFPDPWAKKKKQRHNRLISLEFLKALAPLLKTDGFLWFKTDHEEYFQSTTILMQEAGFERFTKPFFFGANRFESTFELRFRSQNIPTYENLWLPPNR